MNPEKFSCIRTVDKTVKIPLWDMYTTTEYKGIEAALDKWKRQYEKQVGGIVVSYRNVSIPSRLGFHSDRGSYAIYNVRATFDVFCPKVGEIVKGKINRVSSEHIGCLIAEAINVSIRLPRDSPSGLSKYIYLDREILFEIRSFSCKPRALCVNGEVTAKCVELMDEYYPVADEFSYEPTSQAVFGDVPSDAEDLQVDLSILGTCGKKKGKKRGRDETEEEEDATDSPRVKKIKKDLDLINSQEEEASSTDTPKKGKKKSSTDSSKPKKSKKGLISTNSPGMNQVDGDISSIDTPKKGKKHRKCPIDSPKPKKSLILANDPEMTQEVGDTSSINNSNILKMEGATDSPKVKQIQRLQDESSSIDTPKKAKKKKSNSTDSLKASQEDSSSTESAKKMAPKSTDSSQESQSSSTESDKKEKEKSSNKKAKKKPSKSNESPMKIKRELLSSTEDEGSKKKSKKKPKKKSKDSAKSKDRKKSSKKKGKVTASGDILKKDKKKSKKSSKKDDKSKKKSKKDKSEKKKKPKLSNDGDVTLKEIKSEGM